MHPNDQRKRESAIGKLGHPKVQEQRTVARVGTVDDVFVADLSGPSFDGRGLWKSGCASRQGSWFECECHVIRFCLVVCVTCFTQV